VSVHGIVRSCKIANFVEFNVDTIRIVILNSSAVTVLDHINLSLQAVSLSLHE